MMGFAVRNSHIVLAGKGTDGVAGRAAGVEFMGLRRPGAPRTQAREMAPC